jgi:very-short-patch-repair endonuclease
MKQLARALRKQQTDAEKLLWSRLRNRQLEGCKFMKYIHVFHPAGQPSAAQICSRQICRRQQPIGPYIADFLSLEPKLIIELDGGQHAEQQEPDNQRTRYLQALGYRVLRFWNHEVLNDLDAVLEAIRIAIVV